MKGVLSCEGPVLIFKSYLHFLFTEVSLESE